MRLSGMRASRLIYSVVVVFFVSFLWLVVIGALSVSSHRSRRSPFRAVGETGLLCGAYYPSLIFNLAAGRRARSPPTTRHLQIFLAYAKQLRMKTHSQLRKQQTTTMHRLPVCVLSAADQKIRPELRPYLV